MLKPGKYRENYICALCGYKVRERQEQCPNCFNEMEVPKDWIDEFRNIVISKRMRIFSAKKIRYGLKEG